MGLTEFGNWVVAGPSSGLLMNATGQSNGPTIIIDRAAVKIGSGHWRLDFVSRLSSSHVNTVFINVVSKGTANTLFHEDPLLLRPCLRRRSRRPRLCLPGKSMPLVPYKTTTIVLRALRGGADRPQAVAVSFFSFRMAYRICHQPFSTAVVCGTSRARRSVSH